MTEKKKRSREFSRSLYVVAPVKKGDKISAENIRSIRPGFGLHPKHYDSILGKTFNQDIEKGERLSFNHFN
jgi:pseudaminic acid synthase